MTDHCAHATKDCGIEKSASDPGGLLGSLVTESLLPPKFQGIEQQFDSGMVPRTIVGKHCSGSMSSSGSSAFPVDFELEGHCWAGVLLIQKGPDSQIV